MTCPKCTQLLHSTGESTEQQRTSPSPLKVYFRCLGCGRHWIYDRDRQAFEEVTQTA